MSLLRVFSVAASIALAGCGTTPPSISERTDRDIPPNSKLLPDNNLSASAQIEFEIKKQVFCELRHAVRDAVKVFYGEGVRARTVNRGFLPSDWGALVSLSLTVDESSSLGPGISFTEVLPNSIRTFYPGNTVTSPQSFGLSVGGNFSSKATTIHKFDSFYKIGRLSADISERSICRYDIPENDPIVSAGYQPATSSPLITSELGIRDWLIGSLFSTRGIPSDSIKDSTISSKGQPDTITLETKFIITTAGYLNPVWRLVPVSGNTNNTSLLSMDRIRTHSLIITIGPPTNETVQVNLVQQNGNAIANASRTAFGIP